MLVLFKVKFIYFEAPFTHSWLSFQVFRLGFSQLSLLSAWFEGSETAWSMLEAATKNWKIIYNCNLILNDLYSCMTCSHKSGDWGHCGAHNPPCRGSPTVASWCLRATLHFDEQWDTLSLVAKPMCNVRWRAPRVFLWNAASGLFSVVEFGVVPNLQKRLVFNSSL